MKEMQDRIQSMEYDFFGLGGVVYSIGISMPMSCGDDGCDGGCSGGCKNNDITGPSPSTDPKPH